MLVRFILLPALGTTSPPDIQTIKLTADHGGEETDLWYPDVAVQVTQLFTGYVGAMLQQYAANPADWKVRHPARQPCSQQLQ